MMTYECTGELNAEVKARLDRADASDCYINESGDIVLVSGEPFGDLTGLTEVNGSTAMKEGARHYEVFVDEGPAAGRLEDHFASREEAEARAKEATDGRYIVYAIKSDYSDEEVARGAGRGKEESA